MEKDYRVEISPSPIRRFHSGIPSSSSRLSSAVVPTDCGRMMGYCGSACGDCSFLFGLVGGQGKRKNNQQ